MMRKVALLLVILLFIFGGLALSTEEVKVPFGAIKSSCYGEIDMSKAEFSLSEVGKGCVQEEWLEANLSGGETQARESEGSPLVVTITTGPSGKIEYRDVIFEWQGSEERAEESDLKYSYKLEGHDDDWSSWASDTNMFYPDLSNGRYTFKVKAKDSDGNVGKAATWKFVVYPKGYWDEKWAQDPDPAHTKERVSNPEDYNIQGLRVNADFKVDHAQYRTDVEEGVYWVPAATLGTPDDTSNDLLDLMGKPEKAKEEIDVLYEALAFIHIATDPNIHNAKTEGKQGIRWEFPKPAKPAIRDGTVDCASAANIIHYLLEDDYQEVGYVWRVRDRDSDSPGGHLTSYIKHEWKYYFFDPVSLAEKKSKYPVEDGDGHFNNVDMCDCLLQTTSEKYAFYWTQRATGDEAVFAVNTADSNNFALGDKEDKYYYPKSFDGSRLTIWLDPNDTEELLEAPYSPKPPTNQYNVEEYADYQPYKNYLTPKATKGGKPTIKYMPSDVEATPSPSPMTWKTEPHAIGPTTIKMEATSAVGTEGFGVEYYFAETTGNEGADDSGWQTDTTYSDSGLEEDTQYCYKVKVRDTTPDKHLTVWSVEECVTTPKSS